MFRSLCTHPLRSPVPRIKQNAAFQSLVFRPLFCPYAGPRSSVVGCIKWAGSIKWPTGITVTTTANKQQRAPNNGQTTNKEQQAKLALNVFALSCWLSFSVSRAPDISQVGFSFFWVKQRRFALISISQRLRFLILLSCCPATAPSPQGYSHYLCFSPRKGTAAAATEVMHHLIYGLSKMSQRGVCVRR